MVLRCGPAIEHVINAIGLLDCRRQHHILGKIQYGGDKLEIVISHVQTKKMINFNSCAYVLMTFQ